MPAALMRNCSKPCGPAAGRWRGWFRAFLARSALEAPGLGRASLRHMHKGRLERRLLTGIVATTLTLLLGIMFMVPVELTR